MRSTRRLPLVLLVLSAAASCGEPGPRLEIEARRTASQPSSPVIPGATPRQRFEAPGRPAAPQAASGSDNLLAYDLPAGWRALPPTNDRLVNLAVSAGEAQATCYLSFLAGAAGGLEANVNRWRTQLGAEPLAGAAIAALPRHPLLGREATLVEAEGTFVGMGEAAPQPGFGLLGLLVSEPSGSLFLKFTGPAELVAAERARFLAFAASLRLAEDAGAHSADDGHGHSPDDGHDHGDASAQATAGTGSAGSLSWTAPAGWVQGAPRAMREVTFQLGNDGLAECYITRLLGDGGGLLPNLNRWCEQLGGTPLTNAALEALPKVEFLGQRVALLELSGAFTGMDGVTRAEQGLLGVALIGAEESLFVKLTGPSERVRAERANFLSFLASVRETR